MSKLFPTSLVGSYAQPDWLIDREKLAARFPPRVRANELWRVGSEWLEEAQDDATILAIRDQERAGLDIITDGEMRRESYSNRFATALEGVDIDNPGTALDRSGHPNPVPRVVGRIRRKHPVELRDLEFLRANTESSRQDDHPGAVHDVAAGAERLLRDRRGARPRLRGGRQRGDQGPVRRGRGRRADRRALHAGPRRDGTALRAAGRRRALDGVEGTTALHICFGYAAIIHERPEGYSFLPELADTTLDQVSIETAQSNLDTSVLTSLPGKTIILGVLDLSDATVDAPETVAQRIRRALAHVPADRIVAAPDCGLKYLPREAAFGKMTSLVEGASIVRAEQAAGAA